MINTVQKTLKKGDDIAITGFGKFSVTRRGARTGRNGNAFHNVTSFRATPPPAPDDNQTAANLYWGTPGWGFRHIATFHGWGPEDQTDTQAALDAQSPSGGNPHRQDNGSYVYYDYVPAAANPNNVDCTRVVIVRFGLDPAASSDPQAKHIVTSFAYLGHFRKYG